MLQHECPSIQLAQPIERGVNIPTARAGQVVHLDRKFSHLGPFESSVPVCSVIQYEERLCSRGRLHRPPVAAQSEESRALSYSDQFKLYRSSRRARALRAHVSMARN